MHITPDSPDRPTAIVVAARLPFARRSGPDLRVLANIRALAASHIVGVFALLSGDGDPRADLGGCVARVSERFDSEVMARLAPTSLAWLRQPDGHPSDRWYTDGVMSELSDFVSELGADVVVVEQLWLHRYADSLHALGHRVVLDAHGLEGPLHDELALSARNPLADRLAERTSRLEATAFAASDEIWIPSLREAALARHRYGRDLNLAVVPNVVEPERYSSVTTRGQDFVLVFPGAFGAPQNASAARRLLNGIFPAVRQRVPHARLVLVGRDPTSEMRVSAERDEGIQVTGSVEDAIPYLRLATAMPVPLNEGHGTRFKILEAFASKLPVVSTSKGIEGLDAEAGKHYLAAESDTEFVAALTRLAHDLELRQELARSGLELVRERYSLDALREQIRNALREPVA